MQASGLKTAPTSGDRNFMGALIAIVATAALVTVLIVATAARSGVTGPGAAPAPNAIGDAQIQFRADERAAQDALVAPAASNKALLKFRADERSDAASAALESGLAQWYISSRDSNAAGSSRSHGARGLNPR